jgi:hypothetical protein
MLGIEYAYNMNRRRRFKKVNTLVDKFFANTVKSDTCWNWIGWPAKRYGQITHEGKRYYAHRLSFEIHGGKIKKGFVVDHICGNCRCVNPSHLRQITQAQNMQNQRPQKMRSSAYRGVSFDKERMKWKAYVKLNGKIIYVGRFDKEIEASDMVKEKRKELLKFSTI